ncbi:FMN phosphatase YigB (HAD superfamily) [Pedobacter cryoconitis]|uniref:FMN phosphatase YigB (HAD superfamily) n=1 Tax=Pedobacter cryoconitis TaxID=188932 RepID=A0A7W9DZZ1_9SPHI|nr:haloacid dehalogenase [Pedobacter cryoconitis]MBB5637493.1 FMN phosphatase YigB (HAD superfamily) [Pedobacter cryoconitis]
MKYQEYINTKQAFIFGLDDVLYPVKDYQLQVYYLFAQFIEYGEQIDAQEVILFMNETYLAEGTVDIFAKTAAKFELPQKYVINFDLLQQKAKLPLKLLLFAPVLDFLKEVHAAGKPIFLLVEGDPVQQLNKIRQIEWNGLEKFLTVYFSAETGTFQQTLEMIITKHDLKRKEVLVIGKTLCDNVDKVEFLSVDQL